MLAAIDALRDEQNINVEFTQFEGGDQSARALVGGEIDISSTFPSGIMALAAEGNAKLFFNGKRNEWSLVCRTDIGSPSELTGKKIGRHSANDLTNALLQNTITKYGVTPEVLTIPGSENRVVALLQGELDCSPIDIGGLFVLEAERPGGFTAIIRYAVDMPGLIFTTHLMANTAALEADPETWKTLTTYFVKYFRMAVEDPEWLAAAADKYFPDVEPALHMRIAQAYHDYEAFTRDGGLSRESMDRLMQFYVESGGLAAEDVLPFDQYATTEFVDAALQELGQ